MSVANIISTIGTYSKLIDNVSAPGVVKLCGMQDVDDTYKLYSAKTRIFDQLAYLHDGMDLETVEAFFGILAKNEHFVPSVFSNQLKNGNYSFCQSLISSPLLPDLQLIILLRQISVLVFHEKKYQFMLNHVFDEIVKRDKRLLKNIRTYVHVTNPVHVNLLVQYADRAIVSNWFYHPDADADVVFCRLRSFDSLPDFMVLAAVGKLLQVSSVKRRKVFSQMRGPLTYEVTMFLARLSKIVTPIDVIQDHDSVPFSLKQNVLALQGKYQFMRRADWIACFWKFYTSSTRIVPLALLYYRHNMLRNDGVKFPVPSIHALEYKPFPTYQIQQHSSDRFTPITGVDNVAHELFSRAANFDVTLLPSLDDTELDQLRVADVFSYPQFWENVIDSDVDVWRVATRYIYTSTLVDPQLTWQLYRKICDVLTVPQLQEDKRQARVRLSRRYSHFHGAAYEGVFYLDLLQLGMPVETILSAYAWLRSWQGTFSQLQNLVLDVSSTYK